MTRDETIFKGGRVPLPAQSSRYYIARVTRPTCRSRRDRLTCRSASLPACACGAIEQQYLARRERRSSQKDSEQFFWLHVFLELIYYYRSCHSSHQCRRVDDRASPAATRICACVLCQDRKRAEKDATPDRHPPSTCG